MRTDRKLLVLACSVIAMIVLAFAIYSLREDDKVPPPPESVATGAPSGSPPLPASGSPVHAATHASSPANYFPLSDTFLLSYLVEVSYKGASPRFGIAKTTVDGRETIRGKEYFKVMLRVTGIPEMRDPVLRYCRNAGDAWRELDGVPKGDSAVETVTLPLPPRAGLIWDKDTPAERSNWKIEGTETVVLFGKEYTHCLRISYERHLKEEPDYFETGHYSLAPDIGLIKQVVIVAGSRVTFTLDHRTPEDIAFYTQWAGTYQGIRDRQMTGGQIQLFADGRYSMIRSTSDSAVDSGIYEPNPGREGEMLLLDNHGITIVCSYRRKELFPGRATLVLKCLTRIDLGEEYLRDSPN